MERLVRSLRARRVVGSSTPLISAMAVTGMQPLGEGPDAQAFRVAGLVVADEEIGNHGVVWIGITSLHP